MKTKSARQLRRGSKVLRANGTTLTVDRVEPVPELVDGVTLAATRVRFVDGVEQVITHDDVCTDDVWVEE